MTGGGKTASLVALGLFIGFPLCTYVTSLAELAVFMSKHVLAA
jgi:hypothetical protein